MATLKANSKLSRQLTLDGPMLLWRDGADGSREGLLITTDFCTNPSCPERHVFVQVRVVEDTLISAKVSPGKLVMKSRPSPDPKSRPGFFGAVGLDDGRVELRDAAPDREALAWFQAELDAELLAVLVARFEGARRRSREGNAVAEKALQLPLRTPPPAPPAMAPERAPAGPVLASGRGRPGRNDPCPCGSGLKFKRCCLVRVA